MIFHLSLNVFLMVGTLSVSLFKNKSTPAFLLIESIPLFKKVFYCEIFAGAEDARLHTV